MDNANDKVRRACDAAGYTRSDIAAHVGVSKHTVDNWFSSGRPIPPAKLRAINELLNGGCRLPVSYDAVMAFAVRLTPAEYRQLCEVSGARDLSPVEMEAAVRELLQRTWDDLADHVPVVVDEGTELDRPPRVNWMEAAEADA